MNRAQVARIADAVLYEGYILYPYRPSVKNRQRWTFGGLYPESYSKAQAGADAYGNQTECLIHGDTATKVEAVVRFLHLTARVVGAIEPPLANRPADAAPTHRPVDVLRVGEELFHSWQEAEEREVALDGLQLKDLLDRLCRQAFTFRGRSWLEPLPESDGKVVGVLAREQQTVEGEIEAAAAAVGEGLFRLTLRVLNRTLLDDASHANRDEVLLRTLVSTASRAASSCRRWSRRTNGAKAPPRAVTSASGRCWPVTREGRTPCCRRQSSCTITRRSRRRAKAISLTAVKSTKF
jgi:hypothetical protein